MLTCLVAYFFLVHNQHKLTVAFLDVGQGDAIYIEAPNGAQMLIDGGNGTAVLRQLGKQMSFFDHSIDVVIGTHPDEDHIGGLPDVLGRYYVDLYIDPGLNDHSATYETILYEVGKRRIPHVTAQRGMHIVLDKDDGVYFDVLFPDRLLEGVDANTASVVGRLVYGTTSFILTGDSPQAIEKYLVGLDGEKLHSTVLKLGHHGSRTSSSEEFLEAVHPTYAVISVGKSNKYGHPHKEVVDRVAELNIPMLATSKVGTIVFESDGVNIVRKDTCYFICFR
jgi:competence protein ComEC